jgi:hypothetical protein
MKGQYVSISFNNYINSLKKVFLLKKNSRIIITVLTWQDADYFDDLCSDDGGTIPEHINFFNNKPLAKKISIFNDLNEYLYSAKKIPFLTSKNGNYKLFYDIHIWINRYYFCYNIFLKKCFFKYLNTFQRIAGLMVSPEWHNCNYEYEKKIIVP